MTYIFTAIASGCFGFVLAALFNVQSYDRGFDDGFANGIRAAQRMREEDRDG